MSALHDAVRAAERRDPLTGLPNRLWLAEWLRDRCAAEAPFWVGFVEADRVLRALA